MMTRLTNSTAHLISWLSFSEKISKTKVLARYGIVFFSVWLFFFTLITLTKIDASSWFICIFIDVALLAHVLFKHLLTKGLKGKLAKNEIEHKFARITALGLIIALPIGLISTTLGIILNDFALYNGFITAAIIDLIVSFILTCMQLPKNYQLKQVSNTYSSRNTAYEHNPRAHDSDFLSTTNQTGLLYSGSPNYYKSDSETSNYKELVNQFDLDRPPYYYDPTNSANPDYFRKD